MKTTKQQTINTIIAMLIIIANIVFKNNKYILLSSALIVIIMVTIAILDKNYKENYSQYIPKWILTIIAIAGFSLTLLFFIEPFPVESNIEKIMFYAGNAIVAIFSFFLVRGLILKWPSKRHILLPISISIYIIFIGILIWICINYV